MLDRGIATRRGIMCAHREPAYEQAYGRVSLPNSERAQDQSIILPLYPGMKEEEMERVVARLHEAVG